MAKFIGFNTVDALYPPYKLYDAELVKRDLMNHFQTRRGERIMSPEFGTRIYDLLMDPFDDDTKDAIIEDSIRVVQTEPRVKYLNANVQVVEKAVILQISIEYLPDRMKDTLEVRYLRGVDTAYL